MNPTIYVALGVVFLSLSAIYHDRARKTRNPRKNRAVGWVFTLAGAAFFIGAAMSYIAAD